MKKDRSQYRILSAEVPVKTFQFLKKMSDKNDITMSQLVRMALRTKFPVADV